MVEANGHFEFLPNDLRAMLAKVGIAEREAEALIGDPLSAKLWHATYQLDPRHAKFALNWLIGDAVRLSEDKQQPVSESGVSESTLAYVSSQVADGELSSTNAKRAMEYFWEEGIGQGANKDQALEKLIDLIKRKNLLQESDEGALAKIVDEVIAANAQAVADYKAGNQRAFGALVGAAMKATQGQGNPPIITKLLKDRLGQ